jgi:predicted O-methyltransferase YrrM
MWHQITSYFKFLLKSKNQHGVHSPFVFDLLTKCFYDTKKYPAYKTLKVYRNKTISIRDFGADSQIVKSNKKKVTTIAKNKETTFKKQQLLYRVISYFKPDTILELGTSLGLGTVAMAFANPSSKIITLEACLNTSKLAQSYFKEFELKNIHLQNSSFEDVFIARNDRKEDIVSYFYMLLDKTNNDSLLIFNDIYWNTEMTEAWNQIKEHPKVTLSIDTYYWGLLFFRIEQEKQHFTIRV